MERTVILTCEQCGKSFDREPGHYRYHSEKHGLRVFCSRNCAYISRRTDNRTEEQRKADKREYDREYRAKNREKKKAYAKAYFQRTYDPVKAAIERKARMPQHVEYCRQPEYRAKKKVYDRQYRAERMYGAFAEAFLTLLAIDEEIISRTTRYDIRGANGTRNKTQERKRTYARAYSNQP